MTTSNELDEMRSFAKAAKCPTNKAYLNARVLQLEKKEQATVKATTLPPVSQATEIKKPTVSVSTPTVAAGANEYIEVQSFAWDQAGYGSKKEGKISVYVSENLTGVGLVKDSVECKFSRDGFDLKIHGLNGRNFRLNKYNLEKEIIPEDCSFRVKSNKVVITLMKKKGEYGYDSWSQLVSKKKKDAPKSNDPTAGINDLMKQMYEDGDDNMRKAIGEAMLKSRQNPGGMSTPDFGSDV